MKKEKNGLLLNREILTLINLKILITYSGTVAIKITFAQNLHKVDYQIKKNQCILRKKRNVETICLFIFKINVRKIDIDLA